MTDEEGSLILVSGPVHDRMDYTTEVRMGITVCIKFI